MHSERQEIVPRAEVCVVWSVMLFRTNSIYLPKRILLSSVTNKINPGLSDGANLRPSPYISICRIPCPMCPPWVDVPRRRESLRRAQFYNVAPFENLNTYPPSSDICNAPSELVVWIFSIEGLDSNFSRSSTIPKLIYFYS